MDTAAQWPQDIMVRPMEEMVVVTNNSNNNSNSNNKRSSSVERKSRPEKEQVLNCPRCHSTNTKFCYYNNYSLSQPRYFCKTCRRYWTEGGSLRNIPVGGGSRKNKRPSSSRSSLSPSNNPSKKLPDLVQQNPNNNNNNPVPQDLNLGIYSTTPHHHHHHQPFIHLPNFDKDLQLNPSSSSPSALELLTGMTGTAAVRGLSSFLPMHHQEIAGSSSSAGFHFPEFRPSSLNFSLDGLGSNYGSFQGSNGKQLLFPFEDLRQEPGNNNNNSNNQDDHGDHNNNANEGDQQNGNGDHHDQTGNGADHNPVTAGFWNGVIGGGSW